MDKGTVVEVASFVELPQVIEQLGEGRWTVVVQGPKPDRSCLHLYLYDRHVADLQKIKSHEELDELAFSKCIGRVQECLSVNVAIQVHMDLSAIDWLEEVDLMVYHSTSLVGITLPPSIQRVDFNGCHSLQEVVLPEGLEEIGLFWFKDCHSLERVILPSTVKKIDSSAFRNCRRLTQLELPEGLESLGYDVFKGCRRLGRIRIPSTVKKLGLSFSLLPHEEQETNSLWQDVDDEISCLLSGKDIELTADGGSISQDEINCLLSGKAIGFPDLSSCVEEEKLDPTSLAAWWKGVEEVLGNEVLGDDCPALVEAAIPADLWPAFDNSYWCCREWHRLVGLRVPAGVGYIGTGMFEGCRRLETVELPEDVLAIGGDAFYGCSSLKKINLPASLRFIGGSAFGGCCSLEPVALPEGLVALGSIELQELNREGLDQNLQATLAELEELKVSLWSGLGNAPLFDGWIDCTDLALPAGLRLLGSGVVRDCDRLAQLDLPQGLVYIGDSAFEGCHSLKSLELPDGLQFLASRIFYQCDSLESVVIGEGITSLPGVFCFRSSLVSVTLPQSLTAIGEEAFMDCRSLRELALPAHLETIGDEAFHGCNSLERVVFPASLKKLGKKAFGSCKGLQSVVLPATIEEIGAEAFSWCKGLKQVEFTEGEGKGGIIGESAFLFCVQLPRIALPEGIEEIGKEAFCCCKSLGEVVLPKSLKRVGETAFQGIPLKEIDFPEGAQVHPNVFDDNK
ncbi:MAG: leucine-rich repeat domain-containing protein [Spirochaetaceae bacterium]|nr:leucine-rich repeat domain-containing protein [Spirochaetaceae bacterium]